MTALIHQAIRGLSAYQTVPFSGPVKLDAMESPYGIDEGLKAAYLARLGTVDVNRYPDPDAAELKARLRERLQIPQAYQLTLGNGSDELLQLLQLAVGGYGRIVMAPQPSFSMYEIIARYTRAEFIGVDLNERFELSEDAWLEAIETHQPSCVFFAYPNNPTGNFFDPLLIEKTAQMMAGLVVADEAYHAYSGRSMLHAMERQSNIAVVRTLSKSGLAGLRIGYLVSHPVWAEQFEKLRMPYNIGTLNQVSAAFALEHWDGISAGISRVRRERDRLSEALKERGDLEVYSSATNFITVRILGKSAAQVFEDLKCEGILVRKLAGMHPLLANCLRISVGTPSENTQLVTALGRALGAQA